MKDQPHLDNVYRLPVTVPYDALNGHEPADPSVDVAEEAQTRVLALHVHRALRRLSQLEKTVLRLRFGLGGQAPLTLAEVGARVGMSPAGAMKVERRALDRMRGLLDDREAA